MITLDFETFSEAGYKWVGDKRVSLVPGNPGIKGVGAAVYAEHPTTEILSLAYDLHDGQGVRVWLPGMATPREIILSMSHVLGPQTIEAHNSGFEFLIWNLVGVRKYGWPAIPARAFRCSQAKGLAYSLPATLSGMAVALGTTEQKDKEGKRLITKFSVPRTPTKNNSSRRILPTDDPLDFANMIKYNIQDVDTEAAVSRLIPDLDDFDLAVWQTDQAINQRGVYVDSKAIQDCINIVEQAAIKYTAELRELTAGAVESASEIAKLSAWLGANGAPMDSLDKEHVEHELARTELAPQARRVLEIRQVLGSSSVKKLYSMARYAMSDSRIRYVFQYCGGHTRRWAGRGPQFHNFPKAKVDDVDQALYTIARGNLTLVEAAYGDPLDAVAGCLRGLITASPGAELLCSDYSAIEAVVLAFLAGEAWRMDVFRTHGMIYEKSASMISGLPFQEFISHRERTGEHHPLRARLGKFAELASGYGGSVGAWKKFGADKYLTDDEIKTAVWKWRDASPSIRDFWYRIEDAALNAVRYPGRPFTHRGLTFLTETHEHGTVLSIQLLSGGKIYYHAPRIDQVYKFEQYRDALTYMGWKDHHWTRIETYGGKLTENIVQAVARDILAYALVNLEKAGYPVVMHVHDEIIAEVATGTGSLEQFESIMSTMPAWCADWPVKAKGGWRGHRYRK